MLLFFIYCGSEHLLSHDEIFKSQTVQMKQTAKNNWIINEWDAFYVLKCL